MVYRITFANLCEGCKPLIHSLLLLCMPWCSVLGTKLGPAAIQEGVSPSLGIWILFPLLLLMQWWSFGKGLSITQFPQWQHWYCFLESSQMCLQVLNALFFAGQIANFGWNMSLNLYFQWIGTLKINFLRLC